MEIVAQRRVIRNRACAYTPLVILQVYFEYGNNTVCVCASRTNEKLQFVVVNLILAFIVPFMLISVSYTKIFYTVSNHRSLAVDAHIRDERIKLRVATMMLTVIIVFALCWLPLYGIYTYFFFFADNSSYVFMLASQVLRPFFQWLSLLSSSLNPVIYIAYSQKYRRAFHKILLLPCRSKYERVRGTLLRNTETQASEGSQIKKIGRRNLDHADHAIKTSFANAVSHFELVNESQSSVSTFDDYCADDDGRDNFADDHDAG
ncbi:unnamed protein product [Heligmosomoides polygyrus]|uniref:G-protein coupled receptors family 1 profile domain-containing protein n=1 Tax=Heligmosomoides polygyrus TaxID=6339 RepID=A0A3P8EHY0_HELPZ|nr:unnamed protein product [Heligmosomoides polygyrus]